MKKKVVMMFLATLVACGVFTGCGKKDEVSDKGQTKISLGKKIEIDGEGARVSDTTIQISQGGEYSISGEAEQVAIVVDTDQDVKLVLNGVTMINEQGAVIYGEQSESITIETAEGTENILTDGSAYADEENQKAVISSNDDLLFMGKGSLIISGNYKHCIAGDDDIIFKSGNYDLTAKGKDGVHCNETIQVDDGTFQIVAVSDCMESEGNLVVNGGTITGKSEEEGLEGKGEITIVGGSISLQATDDGLNAGDGITIDDGKIDITTAEGDAMDSNGSFIINGGEIVAYGGSAPEGALDCDQQSIVINGGTVIAVGDANSSISTNSKQVSVLLGQYNQGDELSIVSEEGKEVISFTVKEARSNMIITSSKLEEGKSYKVLINGEEEKNFSVDSVVISVGGNPDAMGGGKGGLMQREEGMEKPEFFGGVRPRE